VEIRERLRWPDTKNRGFQNTSSGYTMGTEQIKEGAWTVKEHEAKTSTKQWLVLLSVPLFVHFSTVN